MSSRAFNIADHMKNLQGTRTLASGAKIVGADADSIQAPGLITSAGGGDNTSINSAIGSATGATFNGTVGSSATFPTGHILQVVQTVKTDTYSNTNYGDDYVAIPGMTLEITPASTSNKILVCASITAGSSAYAVFFKLRHNGSGSYADVTGAVGDGSDSRAYITFDTEAGNSDSDQSTTATMMFLDSPSKDTAFSYQVWGSHRHVGTWTINMSSGDGDANYSPRSISTLTLMEIAG